MKTTDRPPDGPNWPAFFRLLALGRLRRLGMAPLPPELRENRKRTSVSSAVANQSIHKESLKYPRLWV